jgi:Ni,Fe-hydrogenase I large subunit
MATIHDYEVDPVSRIEGHLGVKVTATDGVITEANAHGNLWRGFENFLIGRRANDAITFTQRICGVCPVPHGTAATFAADSVLGVSGGYATFSHDQVGFSDGVPEAALHVRNIVLASEFLMSSITHFYHLVAQSYVQGPPIPPWTPYFKDNQYHSLLKVAGHVLPTQNDGTKASGNTHALLDAGWNAGYSNDLWSAVITQYVKALRIRRLCLEAGALFAGRMPMMSNSVAGGTTNTFHNRADFDAKLAAYRTMMEEVGTFVVREYIPLAFALGALYPDFDNVNNTGLAEMSTHAGAGQGFGGGLGNFLAWGGFPQADGTMGIKGGAVVDATNATGLAGRTTRLLENRDGLITDPGSLAYAKDKVEHNLKEFITRSRYANTHGYETSDSAYPGNVTMTEPSRNTASKYSWLKAPRWDGYAMEVGPLARMVVNSYYPVTNTTIIGGVYGGGIGAAYASIYGGSGPYSMNGVDLRVLDRDLVSGVVGNGTSTNVADAVTGWVAGVKGGLSTMDRLRARAIESYWMVRFLLGAPAKDSGTGAISFPSGIASSGNGWVGQLRRVGGTTDVPPFYRDTTPPPGTVSGYGLVEAPRGALGHFITASSGKINSYQCVVPTTWNGSPKNGATTGSLDAHQNTTTNRGAMEQAMVNVAFDGVAMADSTLHQTAGAVSGVEVLRVAQSFDPCIACAVH